MFDIPYDYSKAVLTDLGSRLSEYYFPKDIKGIILLNNTASTQVFNLAAYKPSTTKTSVVEQTVNCPLLSGSRMYLPIKFYSVNGPIGTVGAQVLELY